MPSLEQERAHLALADRHIQEAEERIRKQMAQNTELEEAGLDTKEKHKFLALMIESLDLMHRHRTQIVAALADEESKLRALGT